MTGIDQNQSGLSLKCLLETPYQQKPLPLYDEDLQGMKEVSQFLPCSIASAFLGQSTNNWDKPFCNTYEEWEHMTTVAAYHHTTNNFATPTHYPADYTLDYMDMDQFIRENAVTNAAAAAFVSPYQPPPAIAGSQLFDTRNSNNQRCASLSSSNPSTPHSDAPSPSSPGLTSPNSPESACYSVDYQYDFSPFSLKGQEGGYLAPCKWSSATVDIKHSSVMRKSKKVPCKPVQPLSWARGRPSNRLPKQTCLTYVPEELKDTKYWSRRRKNNLAAKKSRDARRIKENQIAMRATFLEMQNNNLAQEIERLRIENMRLKQKLNKYE